MHQVLLTSYRSYEIISDKVKREFFEAVAASVLL